MINLSMLNKIALQRQTKKHTHNRHWCNVWLADVGEKENMCNCHETYPTPHRFSHSRTPWLWGREHLSIWSDHSYKTKGKCIMLFSSQARSYQTSFMGIHASNTILYFIIYSFTFDKHTELQQTWLYPNQTFYLKLIFTPTYHLVIAELFTIS